MLFWTLLQLAVKSLFVNKLRSFLAMLGIIIGVASVISMLALGSGAQKQVLERVSAMGTNLLVVRPGQRGTGGVLSGSQQNLTIEDALAILEQVEGVYQVAPLVRSSGQIKFLNKNTRSSLMGSATTYFSIRDFSLSQGRIFTEAEVSQRARVAVIGPVTATNLFGEDTPLAQMIKINGVNFQVIGVLKSKGDQGWFNPDDQVIIPYTVAMKQLFGLDYIHEINVQTEKEVEMASIQDSMTSLLRKRHRLQPEIDNDFFIRNQSDIIQTASDFSRTFTILLGGIASISLLVGGIGVMNIMLVTVTERTREIGIRKAIGAKYQDILRQFLIEAMLMSALGGLIGAAIGIGLAYAIGKMSSFMTSIEPGSVILAISFAGAVGVFFGYYPARRAAKLNPIDALRYE